MERNISMVLNAVRQKGTLETCVHIVRVILNRIYSFTIIFVLRIRGYDVDYSVDLAGANVFFQSFSHAIKIGSTTRLGRGTRINAGFKSIIEIGENVLLDDYCFVMAQNSIRIGKNTNIAAFCYITDFNHCFSDKSKNIVEQGYDTKPVIIEENAWIGTHVVILPGVTIGKGSVIGAGSVVTKNIPSNSVAAGNPAKVIRKI